MLLTIFTFIIVLSILVFIHELGHFLVAKKLGIRVEEFGFGLPPRLWGIKRGETFYSINWLPIGGFVKLSGEEGDIQDTLTLPLGRKLIREPDWDRFFFNRPVRQRAAVLLAGVTMNFLLAVVIISYIFTQGIYVPTERVHIARVVENSPAYVAGIKENDVIVSFAEKEIKTSEELVTTTKERAGQETQIVVLRDNMQVRLTVTPRKDPPPDQGPLGIVISNLEEKKYPWYQAPFLGLVEALKLSYLMVYTLLVMLFRLVTFQPIAMEVAGPIGIYVETGKAVQSGLMSVLQLTGLLSLNLAIINILPIPALDGGRLMFVVLEKFIGKKVKPHAERVAHQIGMAFLLALIVLVTINDVLRILRG